MKKLSVSLSNLLVLATTGLTTLTHGQNVWVNESVNSVSIEILKPSFEDDNFTFFTTSIFLSGEFKLSEKVSFKTTIPMASAKLDENFPEFDESEFAFGNIYLGTKIYHQSKNSWWEIGLHLPTASDDKSMASGVGLFSDLNRFESFIIDFITIPVIFNHQKRRETGFQYRLRVGPDIVISTADDSGDNELFFDYGGQVGYGNDVFSVMTGFFGRAIITESDIDFSERTFHQIGVGFNYNIGTFTPGLSLNIPVDDDFSDVLDFTVGLHANIRI